MRFYSPIQSLLQRLLSRRNFIKASSIGFISLFYSCTDDPVKPETNNVPDPDPEPTKTELKAIIGAPSKTRMPLDGVYIMNLNAGNSTPKDIITDYIWAKRKIPETEFQEVGTGENISDILSESGSYEYRLTVKNSNEETSDEILHTFELLTPLQATINGPQTIEYSNGNIDIELDASDSIGEITEYTWTKKIKWNEYEEIGKKKTLVDEIDSVGIYFYTLEIRDNYGQSSIEHEVVVFDPNISIQNSILFTQVSPISPTILSKMDPTSLNIENILIDDTGSLNSELSREPNGTRLILSVDKDSLQNYGRDLFLYETKTGVFEKLHHTNGISWQSEWNPVNSWIAYIEDGRYPRNDRDEIALINADTKELIYLAGDRIDPSEKYDAVGGVSWDPSGSKLLAGSNRYYIAGREYPVRRLSIFSDLFSNNPSRVQLHSEEYLIEYFGSDSLDIHEGNSSVAWSPDGTLVAYNIMGGPYGRLPSGTYILDAGELVVASSDGSGILYIVPDLLVQNIDWSPNGQQLIFDVIDGARRHIYMMDKDGNNLRNINNEIGQTYSGFKNPVWT